MANVRIEIVRAESTVTGWEPPGDIVRIGRSPSNDVVLGDALVSSEHARIVIGEGAVQVEDLHSANGTVVVRDGVRTVLSESAPSATLESGDVIELGGAEPGGAALRVVIEADREPAHVMSVRPIAELPAQLHDATRSRELLRLLNAVQQRVGDTDELSGVLTSVADAALSLVPRATHSTIVLRDEPVDGPPSGDAGYVPVMTRVRGADGAPQAPTGPVPLTRSVLRKVVRERAAVLAADALGEAFSSESLMGASIQSTIGVPLWKGDDILGVLQVDSRGGPATFDATDLDALGALAANASLAVANARLIQRLQAAEARLTKENAYLKGRERARSGEGDIIGQSAAMKAVLSQLDKVVDTRVSVLVEGETGTGKELFACALHHRSRRRQKMFVAQNCAALPENLLESELFGHKRGAFTGATEDKRGLFEVADGGTLFLDEVGEMPLSLQAKLLRVLQEGEVRPLGSPSTRQVDVRVVAATNRSLEKEVAEGRFREDLYYRLRVFPIRVPPLRERPSDVPILAGHFLSKYAREFGKAVAGYAQETLELMSGYDWPGNVRELENEVQRLIIQAEPECFITADLLSARVRKVEGVVTQSGAVRGTLREMVEQVERWFILETLRQHGNNKTNAAKTLGITREGLHKKLRQLKIT